MKTLEQLLRETPANFVSEKTVIDAIKTWLTQKRKPTANKSEPIIPRSKDWCEGYAHGWENHNKELLEELH